MTNENDFVTADVVALNDRQLAMKYKACLYWKLQQARMDFKEKRIKARGRNNFNNFDYITLEDIVNAAVPILFENNLSTAPKFQQYPPVVELIDLETGYAEEFGSNVTFEVEGKNTNQRLQALGSTETYLRRYIYMRILDIVESDPDSDFGRDEVKQDKQSPRQPRQPQRYQSKDKVSQDRINEILSEVGTLEELGALFTSKKINRDEFRATKKRLEEQQ